MKLKESCCKLKTRAPRGNFPLLDYLGLFSSIKYNYNEYNKNYSYALIGHKKHPNDQVRGNRPQIVRDCPTKAVHGKEMLPWSISSLTPHLQGSTPNEKHLSHIDSTD